MTTFTKNALTWMWTWGVALVFGVIMIELSNWFIIAFFGWGLLIAPIFLKRIICQKCRAVINLQWSAPLGLPFNSGPFRTNCTKCGSNLKTQLI